MALSVVARISWSNPRNRNGTTDEPTELQAVVEFQNSVFDLRWANESSKLNSLKERQMNRLPAPGRLVPSA